jgi:hypothetical protein
MYIEISQGDSLCSYLYHKKAKMSLFKFFISFFFVPQNWRIEGKNRSCGGGEGYQWEGSGSRERERGWEG